MKTLSLILALLLFVPATGRAEIGGWTIGATSLSSGSGSTFVALDSGGTNPAIYAGGTTPGSAPFRVTNAGALTATAGNIGGWSIESDRLSSPTSTAVIEAQGVISLGSGTSVVRLSSVNASYRLWVGNENPASAPFRVSTTGGFVATNADITGTLEAGGGSVVIGNSGIRIDDGSSGPSRIEWSGGGNLFSISDTVYVNASQFAIQTGKPVFFDSTGIWPQTSSSTDIGISALRFRDLYLSGQIRNNSWNGGGNRYVCADNSGTTFVASSC